MISPDLARQRLYNQHISHPSFQKPADVVAWLGAVQAQDFLGALWAVGLRMPTSSEAEVERALTERAIVRTLPMRGTLHFIAAKDVRWMLALLTPRILARHARRLKQEFELDDGVFRRSRKVFERVLRGGQQLSRTEVYRALEGSHISTAGQRGLHILWRHALEGFICFGARRGKQQTFTLLDEWIPARAEPSREEALARLTRRYFAGHGPATVQDFAWWSGLAAADTRAGLVLVQAELEPAVIEGRTHWFSTAVPIRRNRSPKAYLLPSYDEYLVGYDDRDAVLEPGYSDRVNVGTATMVLDGKVVGRWKRVPKRRPIGIETEPFIELNWAQSEALRVAALRYARFHGNADREDVRRARKQ